LCRDGEPPSFTTDPDGWDGQFITTHTGRLPTRSPSAGCSPGRVGRWRGPYVLRSGKHERGDRSTFWVERGET
jgi:hypothetical protein